MKIYHLFFNKLFEGRCPAWLEKDASKGHGLLRQQLHGKDGLRSYEWLVSDLQNSISSYHFLDCQSDGKAMLLAKDTISLGCRAQTKQAGMEEEASTLQASFQSPRWCFWGSMKRRCQSMVSYSHDSYYETWLPGKLYQLIVMVALL